MRLTSVPVAELTLLLLLAAADHVECRWLLRLLVTHNHWCSWYTHLKALKHIGGRGGELDGGAEEGAGRGRGGRGICWTWINTSIDSVCNLWR